MIGQERISNQQGCGAVENSSFDDIEVGKDFYILVDDHTVTFQCEDGVMENKIEVPEETCSLHPVEECKMITVRYTDLILGKDEHADKK